MATSLNDNDKLLGFRIGEWTVQPSLNRLTGPPGEVQVEPRLMELLQCLAQTPGKVLSRHELLDLVWGDITVGEEALTRAISELRRVLGDQSNHPKYIETIRKRGYRLLPTVDPMIPEKEPIAPVSEAAPPPKPEPRTGNAGPGLRIIIPAIAALIVLIWLSAGFVSRAPSLHATNGPLRTLPLTTYPGVELNPALSPDGSSVAFVWDGPDRNNWDIYVKQIGEESALRLTDAAGRDSEPAWSPGGKSISYLHTYDDNRQGVWSVPLLGGEPREIFKAWNRIWGFTWGGNNTIIYGNMEITNGPTRLYQYNIATGENRLLVLSPYGTCDFQPTMGPDGVTLAFFRIESDWSFSIILLDMESGKTKCLVSDLEKVEGLCWDNQGRSLIFSSRINGAFSLRRAAIDDGTISWIPLPGEKMFSPTVSRNADCMAFQHSWHEKNIWRIVLQDSLDSAISNEPLIASSHADFEATYSPDGSRIAFTSDRSGDKEIWICNADGTEAVQLTEFHGPDVGAPSWSPNGSRIVLSADSEGFNNLFIVDITDRRLHQLTRGYHHDVLPSYSSDGKWIFCNSKRDGMWKIWRISAEGDSTIIPEPVSNNNFWQPKPSKDGRYLYFSNVFQAGLWRLPLKNGLPDGPAEQILDELPRLGDSDQWDYYSGGLFLFDHTDSESFLVKHDFSSEETIIVTTVSNARHPSVSISLDGHHLLYSRLDNGVDDLVLVEGFK